VKIPINSGRGKQPSPAEQGDGRRRRGVEDGEGDAKALQGDPQAVDEDSVKVVQDILGSVSREAVTRKLRETGGDPVEAILALEQEMEGMKVGGEEAAGANVRRARVPVTIGTAEDNANFIPFPREDGTPSSGPSPQPNSKLHAANPPVQAPSARSASTQANVPAADSVKSHVPRPQEPPKRQAAAGAVCGIVTQNSKPPVDATGGFTSKTAMFKAIAAASSNSGQEDALLACLSRITPAQLPKLLGAGLEEEDLLRLFRAAAAAAGSTPPAAPGRGVAFRLIEGMAKVPRANLTTSMLGKADRREVEGILDTLEPRQGDAHTAGEWLAAKQRFLQWP